MEFFLTIASVAASSARSLLSKQLSAASHDVGSFGRTNALLSLAALALWMGWMFWKRELLEPSMMALLYAVSREYAVCFPNIAVLGQAGDCLPILSVLAMPFCWLTAWTVCREGSALFLLLLCAPVLILCLIIVELAPVFWLTKPG